MGGAVGHLQHLYDDRDLTFKDLKKIINTAASGKLSANEKLDGLNVVFTWDCKNDTLKVARSVGDIKRFGLDAFGLSKKFLKHKREVRDAFMMGYKVLKESIASFSCFDKRRIFGKNSNKWYSAEIISSESPNVIHYDENFVMIHKWPIFSVKDGEVSMTSSSFGANLLIQNLEKTQPKQTNKEWKICGPAPVKLREMKSDAVDEFNRKLSNILETVQMTDSATIGQFLRARIRREALGLNLSDKEVDAVVSRCMKDDGCFNLNDIRKITDKKNNEVITAFIKTSPDLLRECLRPIELAVNDFAVCLLAGFCSSCVLDSASEIKRLQDGFLFAKSKIEQSGNKKAIDALYRQMDKLKSVEKITTSVEGVVFLWRGKAYKFTGNFSVINQVMGLLKYGTEKL